MRFYYLLSVMVNGSPSKLFKASSGIRQGIAFLLSSFMIVVEVWSLLSVRARDLGLISGFEPSSGGELVTHLKFADNTILFSSTKRQDILSLRKTLCCFQLV